MPLYRRGRGDFEIQRFLETTQAVLGQIASFHQECETQNTNLDDLENAVNRTTEICTTFGVLGQSAVPTNSAAHNSVVGLMTCLDAIRTNLYTKLEALNTESACYYEYQCPVSCSGEKGRPRLAVMKDQLEFLRSKHFRWASFAKLLGISELTLRRRREEFGLEAEVFTEISEENLTTVVQSVKSVTPNIGQSRMIGALRSRGLHVQRWRVREIMRKIDPIGTALRRRCVVLPDEVMDFLGNIDPLQDDGNNSVNLYLMCLQAILTSVGET